MLALVVLKDSGEVTLAIARAWMLLFTKLRVSIQLSRLNIGKRASYSRQDGGRGAGRDIGLLYSFAEIILHATG